MIMTEKLKSKDYEKEYMIGVPTQGCPALILKLIDYGK